MLGAGRRTRRGWLVARDLSECGIIICHRPPTWRGTLSFQHGMHSLEVAYCDEHAAFQRKRVEQIETPLILTLTKMKESRS